MTESGTERERERDATTQQQTSIRFVPTCAGQQLVCVDHNNNSNNSRNSNSIVQAAVRIAVFARDGSLAIIIVNELVVIMEIISVIVVWVVIEIMRAMVLTTLSRKLMYM